MTRFEARVTYERMNYGRMSKNQNPKGGSKMKKFVLLAMVLGLLLAVMAAVFAVSPLMISG
jgi:hypothetical protein